MAESATTRSGPPGDVRLVVAHAREARPFIDYFRLQAARDCEPLRVYARDNVSLVVSRLGKVSAAHAVAQLEGRMRGPAAWLNVGVAGHRSLPLGSVRLVHKVIDSASGECWYPQRTFEAPCPSASLVTVDRPETDYREDALYDMEGAGFCKACARDASLERVQLVKVVSDNAAHPIDRFEPRQAERLLGSAIDVVERVVDELAHLSAEVAAWRADPPGWSAFVERWHFTVTQRRQLRRALQRWSVLRLDTPAIEVAGEARSAREVLARLRASLHGAYPDFGVARSRPHVERS